MFFYSSTVYQAVSFQSSSVISDLLNETDCATPLDVPVPSSINLNSLIMPYKDGLLMCGYTTSNRRACRTWQVGEASWTVQAAMAMNDDHSKSGNVAINRRRGEAMVLGDKTASNVMEILEADGTWHVKKEYPGGNVRGITLVVKDTNNIYAIGGYNKKTVYRYSRLQDDWVSVPDLPNDSHIINCARLLRSGKVVIVCVDTDDSATLVLDPAVEAAGWQPLAGVTGPAARYGSLVAVIHNVMYLVAGYASGGNTGLDEIVWYDPSDDSWSTPVAIPARSLSLNYRHAFLEWDAIVEI